jgi:hypothetical protein
MAGLGARISGCRNQKEESLEDQTDHNKEVVTAAFEGLTEYLTIATIGKGERLDRPELEQIEAEFRKSILDVFVWEDLGRLVRGVEAVRLLGIAVDHGIRVICPNDNVDTANETWEADAIKACADHVAHQEHTSRRLKHKLKNRFVKYGQAMARPIASYIVPEGAKSYDDWKKDPRYDYHSNPEADPWIRDGVTLLRATLNCSLVAEMFNKRGIPTGPYCRKKKWTGAMVRHFYSNPLLKGRARRNEKHSIKIHETGVRTSVTNPDGPVYYDCPHLAYFTADEFDELNALLAERNSRYSRGRMDRGDPRLRVPRKQTRFPGQHGRCWYCGHQHVWGGNGMTGNLMCNNAREWQCWNSVGYNGALAVERLTELIMRELHQLDGFDAQYRELVEHAGSSDHSEIARQWERLKRDEADLAKRRVHFVEAIAKFGPQEMFDAQFKQIEADERNNRLTRSNLERLGQERLDVPGSTPVLRQMLEEEFAGAARDSQEFNFLLRKLCPDFYVYLVRLCDGGHLLPRAYVRLRLDGIIPDATLVPGLGELLQREAMLDIFELPQRERIREDAVRWKEAGLSLKEIAAKIAATTDERPTATAVQNALALHARMLELGLSTPFVRVDAPPEDYPKLRRHKNRKYRFVPLEGYIPPKI